MALLASSLHAATYHVKTDGDDTSDGLTWATAHRTLQHALVSATAGDEVWIASGTYYPNDPDSTNLDRTQSFALKNNLAVYGGFTGNETSLAERDPSASPTILSGDLGRDDIDQNGDGFADRNTSNNAYHVFYHPPSLALNNTAVLDSVTICSGRADGSTGASSRSGGGMRNLNSVPTLQNCHFDDCGGDHSAGALYLSDVLQAESLQLTNCRFTNNTANFGGAIDSAEDGKLSIQDCLFSKNQASLSGGALSVWHSAVTAEGCTFVENTAEEYGGAINNWENGNLEIISCSLIENFSGLSGGAISNWASQALTVTNCTFYNNLSDEQGDALYNWVRSIFRLTHCTLLHETGSSNYAVYDDRSRNGSVIRNSILWGNYPPRARLTNVRIIVNSIDYSNRNTDTPPLLLPLGDYGGPTPTLPPAPGSPAIDAGATTTLTADQRGLPRLVGSASDIGAVEWQASESSSYYQALWTTDFDGDGIDWGVEQALGTDPYLPDPQNPLHLTTPSFGTSGSTSVAFGRNPEAMPGTIWTLTRSPDLQAFTEIYRFDGTNETTGPEISSLLEADSFIITDGNSPSGKAFYRIEAHLTPQP